MHQLSLPLDHQVLTFFCAKLNDFKPRLVRGTHPSYESWSEQQPETWGCSWHQGLTHPAWVSSSLQAICLNHLDFFMDFSSLNDGVYGALSDSLITMKIFYDNKGGKTPALHEVAVNSGL